MEKDYIHLPGMVQLGVQRCNEQVQAEAVVLPRTPVP